MRYDEIGLYVTPNRTYVPGIGRWLQMDPAGIADGLNRYAYVGNDPLSGFDPLGLANEGNTCGRTGGVSCSGSYAGDGITPFKDGTGGDPRVKPRDPISTDGPRSVAKRDPRVGATAGATDQPGKLDLFNDQYDEYKFFKKIPSKDGEFRVGAHGHGRAIELQNGDRIGAREASKLIKGAGYKPGSDTVIVLFACNSGSEGSGGFAQELANLMHVTVKAPTNIGWLFENGYYAIAPSLPDRHYPDLKQSTPFATFNPQSGK
ncbi:RHS repeat-associated protein [Nitrospirillum amazonense]|uniref:RHS repeat-associated protein n=2 Tax=Nitrospirillum amazonense TaxID=28077 RepID=A0A560EGU7_9PROT|nr:RHS repeat-associated protein [Nitrospirillum amazonense]